MKKIIVFFLTLLFANTASAWTATYLGGGNWAIGCANGQNFSYSGGSSGLDVIGPALCPGGIVEDLDTVEAISTALKVEKISSAGGFPPNGYPCLGCEPCPGDESEYCDTTSNPVLGSPDIGTGVVVWSLKGFNIEDRKRVGQFYGLPKVNSITNVRPLTSVIPTLAPNLKLLVPRIEWSQDTSKDNVPLSAEFSFVSSEGGKLLFEVTDYKFLSQ